MPLFAQRRRHHIFRPFEVRYLRVASVEHQIRNHGFHPNPHAPVLRPLGNAQRIFVRRMHRVHVRASQPGKGRQMVHALGFHERRPRRLLPFRTRFAFGDQPLLHLRHGLGVFAVCRHNHAMALGKVQRAKQFRIVHAKRPLVRQEDFERGGAVVHNLLQLIGRFLIEPRHAHVICEIASRLPHGLRFPQFVGLERIVGLRRAHHFNHRRRAADQRRPAAGRIRILGERAHERQIDVHVRIDEAGKHELPRGVNHLRPRRRTQVRPNRRDRFVLAPDIRLITFGGGHNFRVLHQ